MLHGLLTGGPDAAIAGLINLTPYDSCIEQVALRWNKERDANKTLKTLSAGVDREPVEYSEKVTAMFLFDQWKSGNHILGDVRPYDPTTPAMENINLSDFPLKLATITVDREKQGWQRYKVSLSNQVRGLHINDPLHSGQWRELILDFDKRLLDTS